MDILIGASHLFGPATGVARYTRQTARHMERAAPENRYSYSYGVFTTRRPLSEPLHAIASTAHAALTRSRPLTSVLRGMRWAASAALQNSSRPYDVYFEPNFVPLPVKARRLAVMVHDFAFHHHPQWVARERLSHLRRRFYSEIQKADVIVTGSNHVREEALQILGWAADRVTAVPEGVDADLFRPQSAAELARVKRALRLPDRFLLSVGSLERRKNLGRLMAAYDTLPAAVRASHPLLLAGPAGEDDRDLAGELARRPNVRCLGLVPDADLPALYASATLFVYPSLYEGFGLPPLEAMACGAPVAASNAAAMPEVLGEGAAFFDPLDVESMAFTIARLLESDAERTNLSRRGLARAALFSWDNTARGLLAAFSGRRATQALAR